MPAPPLQQLPRPLTRLQGSSTAVPKAPPPAPIICLEATGMPGMTLYQGCQPDEK